MTRPQCWILSATVALTLVLGGCQGSNGGGGFFAPAPPTLKDPLATLLVTARTARELGNYVVSWQAPLALKEKNKPMHFEVLGSRIVSIETGNYVSVIDSSDGQVIWRNTVGHPQEHLTAPRRVGRALVVCSNTRSYVYDIEQGRLATSYPLQLKVAGTTPVLHNKLMIHGSATGTIFAQDMDHGRVHWKYDLRAPTATSLFLSGGALIATNEVGEMAAFSPSTGILQWRVRAFKRINAATPSPTSPLIYAASEDMSLYAWDRNNGALRWRNFYDKPLRRAPSVLGEVVLLYVKSRGLIALNAFTGKELWVRPDLHDSQPLMTRKGSLYLHRPGSMLLINPKDGMTVRKVPLPKVHRVRVDKVMDGNIYLQNNDGRITKLTAR
jgi:outer membrane protein assembly factor BamB